ncbi:unnamed protein product [Closterium sp. NIES-64]|nr:unnamed protein product [Closterium sp. NIES-64]CAI6002710.1 unnamed protein product [Closterium sp. NIES-65]
MFHDTLPMLASPLLRIALLRFYRACLPFSACRPPSACLISRRIPAATPPLIAHIVSQSEPDSKATHRPAIPYRLHRPTTPLSASSRNPDSPEPRASRHLRHGLRLRAPLRPPRLRQKAGPRRRGGGGGPIRGAHCRRNWWVGALSTSPCPSIRAPAPSLTRSCLAVAPGCRNVRRPRRGEPRAAGHGAARGGRGGGSAADAMISRWRKR